jgi:hypothetical protein
MKGLAVTLCLIGMAGLFLLGISGNTAAQVFVDDEIGTYCTDSVASATDESVVIYLYYAAPGRTGQTKSYGARDDGKLRRGIAWPKPRFTDMEDGTVKDNLTGLTWLKDANCLAFYSGDETGDNERDWKSALAAANKLKSGECGLSDSSEAGEWRLPNIKELESILDYAYHLPALSNAAGTGQWTEGHPFTGVEPRYYWSSSTVSGDTNYGWVTDLFYGYVYYHHKTFPANVWPVRGGK